MFTGWYMQYGRSPEQMVAVMLGWWSGGIKLSSYNPRKYSIALLLCTEAASLIGYVYRIESTSHILLNLRFLIAVIPLTLTLLMARQLRQPSTWCQPKEKQWITGLYSGLAIAVFVLLTLETYYHAGCWVTNREQSR